jgi:UDP-N-acetylmuramate dehydrogenase
MLTASRRTSLFSDLDVDATADAPLAALTWLGIGGRADALVRPRSVEALCTLVARCHLDGTPLRVLGAGANLLVADEGVDGVVVRLDAPPFLAQQLNRGGSVEAARLFAGADLPRAIVDSVRLGLGGLETLAGIPATVGGAVRMNAGGVHGSIADRLIGVQCITTRGEIATYPAASLQLDYRHCRLPGPVLLSAAFRLEEGDPVSLRRRLKEIMADKATTQPLGEHSAGCMFRNPPDPHSPGRRTPAGRLIDAAGLKGLAVGGASVSHRHANFMIVQPGTTATEVLDLSDLVRARVLEHSGIELEREVVVWRRGAGAES